ncbi:MULTISPECIES: guanylate kinase [unclassified Caloramator]|uniref:guanylate kinase n=1 Tax=unclassified Caloramator TaxID=2629145 RepID=UPI00237DDCC8|nr:MULTISPECIES: guanylate kinase [unclassified Caloramator]MDO6354152.1 guanylate kinase [Caloramator sp. CAR-1]WDU84081.1 guanylate kinase [Caloramator sp. Dgby_cultured_2]
MQRQGLLIVISGPSGAGKGTICKALLQKNKDLKISVSCTTRSPREGEREGINYYFVSKEKFQDMIEKNEFLEYATVYGNYYGTPRKYVEEELKKGNDVILEIDIQGALMVKERYPEGVFIFILPPSMEELKNRIIKRGSETEDSLNTRFTAAFEEIKYMSKYDYAVVNDYVDEAVKKIECIIVAEKCKCNRMLRAGYFEQEG